MQERTIRALNAINLQFYATHAKQFTDVRKSAWPGFADILRHVEWPVERPLRVLDLGSGSGRFAKALLKEQRRESSRCLDYVGVDSSQQMLRVMHENLEAALEVTGLHSRVRLTYLERDLVLGDAAVALSGEGALGFRARQLGFDLVVLFGLMHHVPSLACRRRLLADASRHVGAGGLLAVSFWRFAEEPRFHKKMLSLKDHGPALGVDPTDLEPGDCLLSFGTHDSSTLRGLRYCHASNQPEIDELLSATELQELARFDSDGASKTLNHYRLMRRVSVSPSESG